MGKGPKFLVLFDIIETATPVANSIVTGFPLRATTTSYGVEVWQPTW